MIYISLGCSIAIWAGVLYLRILGTQQAKMIGFLLDRIVRLERVVRAVRSYREHGTASTWLGVLAQLHSLDTNEPLQAPPDSAKR